MNTKLLIAFSPEDIQAIDQISKRYGLPSRASAVRLALRGFGGGISDGGNQISGDIAPSDKRDEEDDDPLGLSELEAGWVYLEDVAARTGAKYAALLEQAREKKKMSGLGAGPAGRLKVRKEFERWVEEQKERAS